MPLKEIVCNFLINFLKKSRAKFKLIKNVTRISQEGEKYELDFLIDDELTNEEIGVKCKDWDRSLSITVVNSFVKAIKQLGLSSGLLMGDRFSTSAEMRAEELEWLNLMTRGRMITWLLQHGKDVHS